MAQILNFPTKYQPTCRVAVRNSWGDVIGYKDKPVKKPVGVVYEYILQRLDADDHVEWQIRGYDHVSNIKRVAQHDYDALSDLVGEPREQLLWQLDDSFSTIHAVHDGYQYKIRLFEERNHAS